MQRHCWFVSKLSRMKDATNRPHTHTHFVPALAETQKCLLLHMSNSFSLQHRNNNNKLQKNCSTKYKLHSHQKVNPWKVFSSTSLNLPHTRALGSDLSKAVNRVLSCLLEVVKMESSGFFKQ